MSDDTDDASTASRENLQHAVIAALEEGGDAACAARLARCAAAQKARTRWAWPWRCGSAACAWCGPRAARRWWRGMKAWAGDRDVLRVTLPAGDLSATPALRRALRDVRDRAARTDPRYAKVCMVGIVGADLRAALLVIHPSLPRVIVERVLQRRWRMAEFDTDNDPDFVFAADLAATLGRARRGTEPLRIVVMPQRPRVIPEAGADAFREPMPMLVV